MPLSYIVILFVFLISTALQAKETITWVKWKLTPEYMETGEFKGQGFLDKFLDHTIALMPEYEHEVQF